MRLPFHALLHSRRIEDRALREIGYVLCNLVIIHRPAHSILAETAGWKSASWAAPPLPILPGALPPESGHAPSPTQHCSATATRPASRTDASSSQPAVPALRALLQRRQLGVVFGARSSLSGGMWRTSSRLRLGSWWSRTGTITRGAFQQDARREEALRRGGTGYWTRSEAGVQRPRDPQKVLGSVLRQTP